MYADASGLLMADSTAVFSELGEDQVDLCSL